MDNNIQVKGTAIGGAFSDISEIESEFIQYFKDAGRAESTIRIWGQSFKHFKEWNVLCNFSKSLSDTSQVDLDNYSQWLDASLHATQSSRERLMWAVSTFIRWKNRTDDLTGHRFNNLIVLGIDHATTNNKGGGKHIKWICRCETCGNIKSIRGSELKAGNYIDCGCTANLRISAKLANAQDMIGRQFGHLHVLYRDTTKPRGSGLHAWYICRCDLCGREESISGHRLRGASEIKDRCSYCVNKSLGEATIRELLDCAGICYKTEQTFEGCINPLTNYKLRFDFRVMATNEHPEYLIEFDGEQHFHVAPMWDDTDDLSKREYKDKIKTDWCLQTGMPLIRIPYTHLKHLGLRDLLLDTTEFLVSREVASEAVS